MLSPAEIARRQLTRVTHRIHSLPVLVLMPHSRCNCRCVMCDIWRANRNGTELSPEILSKHLQSLRRFGVRWVVLSGGEALMHSDLWALCALLKQASIKVTLLSTGLLLKRHAAEVVRWCDEVIVSLDGSRAVHDRIRNVPDAFARLEEGVAALRAQAPGFRVTARCVLQRSNFFDLPNIIQAAHDLALDQISFLAADVSTQAFNRAMPWDAEQLAAVALTGVEVESFRRVLEQTLAQRADDFSSGYVAESPQRMRRLPQYYAALLGEVGFPAVVCNAPWVSAVIEADGTVRPCFFHRPLGNIHERGLEDILNSAEAIAFRRRLDVRSDEVCRQCVCTLQLGSGTPV